MPGTVSLRTSGPGTADVLEKGEVSRLVAPMQLPVEWIGSNGGHYRDRTCDPFHVKEVLYR